VTAVESLARLQASSDSPRSSHAALSPRSRSRRIPDPTLIPIIALAGGILLFLAAPIAGLFFNLSGSDIKSTYGASNTHSAILTSLATASASTAIVGVLGIPLAFILARYRFRGRTLVNVLVFLPLVLPPVSAGILLLLIFGPYGTIGQLFSPHGIDFVDTSAGVVLAQVFVSAPYVIVASRSAFEWIDSELIEAAASMGASSWQIFRRVGLPLAWGGIAAGLLLGWMRALGEFGATVILAYHPYTLPVLNYVNLNGYGLGAALPLALLALIVAMVVLLVLFFLEKVDWSARIARPLGSDGRMRR
jgi:ABC-type sulfate transport system permease component